jgi:uncharacterized protein YlxP (DUF503 family)
MIICGRLLIKVYLPDCHSLKQKRSVIKSILAKTRHQFNLASAEVDFQDVWQSALLGFCTIGAEAVYINTILQKVIQYIEINWPDIQVLDIDIELF